MKRHIDQDDHQKAVLNKKQRVLHNKHALISQSSLNLPASARERYLQLHKHAVHMNNYGMALLETHSSVERAIKALKEAIDTMVLVTRPPNDPLRKPFETSTRTKISAEWKESSSPPSWEGFVLQMPTQCYPVGHSQPREDVAAILFNMSLAFYILGSKSGERKWINKGQGLYNMSQGMARKVKSDELTRRQAQMMFANLRKIGRLCVYNLACQYLNIASSIHPGNSSLAAEGIMVEPPDVASSKAA